MLISFFLAPSQGSPPKLMKRTLPPTEQTRPNHHYKSNDHKLTNPNFRFETRTLEGRFIIGRPGQTLPAVPYSRDVLQPRIVWQPPPPVNEFREPDPCLTPFDPLPEQSSHRSSLNGTNQEVTEFA